MYQRPWGGGEYAFFLMVFFDGRFDFLRSFSRPKFEYRNENPTSVRRQSYKPPEPLSKRSAVMPEQNFWPIARDGEGIDTATTQRASYPEWPCGQRLPSTLPGEHEIGHGGQQPMQVVTSNRHDYVAYDVPEIVRYRSPDTTIDLSNGGGCACGMAALTTTADTFGTNRPDTVCPRKSARPATAGHWSAADARMTAVTETSASFQPWDPLSLSRPTDGLPYCRPDVPVDNCTVYKNSYKPPGQFRDPLPGEPAPAVVRFGTHVDCDGRKFFPRAHDYNL